MQMNSNDVSDWLLLAPLLDQAMDGLREKDREAVLLRFFENKSLERVASALGISEEAAKKRVARALERLRSSLARTGAVLSLASIGGLMSANAVQGAPAGLATAAAAAAVKGSAAGASTLAAVNGTLKLMAWAKLKFALAITGAALAVGGGVATFLLVGSPSAQNGAVAVIHLEGTSTRHAFDDKGREIALDLKDEHGNILSKGDSVNFSLWQSGAKWAIHFWHSVKIHGSVTDVSCDGTNIYTYVPDAGGTLRVGTKLERYQNSASVSPGTLKILHGHLAPIWWAYCSAATIAQDGPVPDFGMWGPYSGDMKQISSELNLRRSGTNSIQPRVGPAEASLYRHTDEAHFDTVPTVEIKPMEESAKNSFVFVTRFALNRYRDSRTMRVPGGPPELLERFDVVLSNFNVDNSHVSFVPKMTGRTEVQDYRFSRMETYLTDQWLDIDGAKRMRENLAVAKERSRIHTGQPAPVFEAKTTTGRSVSFPGEYRGKLILMDFWATWCGPCVAELPNLIAAYEKFHSQGLDILGVSLDDTNSAQKLAVFCQAHSLAWPQIHDRMVSADKIAERYHIDGIPHAFLVDGSTGLVLSEGEDLRGDRLIPTLESAIAARKSN